MNEKDLYSVVAGSSSAPLKVNAIVKEEFLVQGRDQRVKLFIREKRLSNLPKIAKENVVLFGHGLPGPGSVIF